MNILRTATVIILFSVLCGHLSVCHFSPTETESCTADTCPTGKGYATFAEHHHGWSLPEQLFKTNMDEVINVELEVLFGKVPEWLDGSVYRVGPGLFEFGERKVTNMVDGLSKVHRWSFSPGKIPSFSGSFLKSDMYNRTIEQQELVAMRHLGQMFPPATTFERMKIMFYYANPDNNNIAAWELGKDGVTITAESPTYIDVDFKTLNFQRKYKTDSDDAGFLDQEFLSASHFWRHPSSGDSINYKLVFSPTKKLLSKEGPAYNLYRYRQNEDGKIIAKYVGKVPIEDKDFRVVHTLGATENYIVLPRMSLYVEFNDPVDIGQNIKFSKDKPTYFDVVSLKDGTRHSFTFEAFESQHLFNSYERHNDQGELEVVIDFPTLDNVDNMPDKNIFELLNIENLVNPDFHYKENWEPYTKFTIRRFILNIDTGKGTVYDYPRMWSPDNLQVEFPYINDAYRGLPYCYVYLHTWNMDAHNAMGLMKVDMCKETSIGWQEVNKFPVEPVFAARPGATDEDDGVIMSPVYDSAANSTEFYVWDAKTLEVVSIVSTPINVPYTIHGIWIKGV